MNYDGVIFDMDGTVIESLLDFAAIRQQLKVPAETGILEHLDGCEPSDRQAGHQRLLEHELDSARRANLIEGALELIDDCRSAGLKTALLTRNTRQAVDIVLERFDQLRFDLIRTREDGRIKPEPDGVLSICRELDLSPARTLCVGDFEYEIVAANRAGATSVLFRSNDLWADFTEPADHVIDRLDELRPLLGLECGA